MYLMSKWKSVDTNENDVNCFDLMGMNNYLWLIVNEKFSYCVISIFFFIFNPNSQIIHSFFAFIRPVLNTFMLGKKSMPMKKKKQHLLISTFPSSNRRVTMMIDSIRNCQIIRRKSYRVASVGAREFQKYQIKSSFTSD